MAIDSEEHLQKYNPLPKNCDNDIILCNSFNKYYSRVASTVELAKDIVPSSMEYNSQQCSPLGKAKYKEAVQY